MSPATGRLTRFLRSTERYTKTDMVYLATSGFWGNLGTLTVTLFSLALYLVFAHYLTREAFGTYQYLLSVGAVLGALTFTGINVAVTNAVAKGADGEFASAVRFQLRWSFVPLVVALLAGLYYFVNDNTVLALGVLVVGVCVPFINAWNTYSAFLLGKQDFRRVFLYNFAINLPFYLLLMAAAIISDSPLLLIGTAFVVQVIGYFVAYRATLAAYRPRKEVAPEGTLRYGTHLSAMGVLGILATQADAILAFHYLGAAGLAVYAFAVAVPERLGGLAKFLPAAALPKFSNRPFEEARAGTLRKLPLAAGALLGIAAAYALAAPYLFSLLFPTYADAVPYSQWYSLAILSVLTQVLVMLLSAHRFVRRLYAFNIASPLLQLFLQAAGVILFGLLGLVLGRLLGVVLAFCFAFLLVLSAKPASAR